MNENIQNLTSDLQNLINNKEKLISKNLENNKILADYMDFYISTPQINCRPLPPEFKVDMSLPRLNNIKEINSEIKLKKIALLSEMINNILNKN